jgi:hypothetical protein
MGGSYITHGKMNKAETVLIWKSEGTDRLERRHGGITMVMWVCLTSWATV